MIYNYTFSVACQGNAFMNEINISNLLWYHFQTVICFYIVDLFIIQVCAYNRTVEKVDKFLAKEAKGTKVIGAKSLEDMVNKLKKPRRIMLLVKGAIFPPSGTHVLVGQYDNV